jgi:hypothetical protein
MESVAKAIKASITENPDSFLIAVSSSLTLGVEQKIRMKTL